jgi:repressor LexA
LTEKGMGLLGEEIPALVNSFVKQATEAISRMITVPMLGQIVAGEPIEVGNDSFEVFDEDDVIEISSNMLSTKKTDDLFALRVNGESMIDAMVNDGDIVIMRQQEVAQNGDMVAVWLHSTGTTTLKHFFQEGKQIRLQPANPTMQPIIVPADDVRVQGKVMMVLRQTA